MRPRVTLELEVVWDGRAGSLLSPDWPGWRRDVWALQGDTADGPGSGSLRKPTRLAIVRRCPICAQRYHPHHQQQRTCSFRCRELRRAKRATP